MISLGAEGVMLKDPNSEYENRRSRYLLKVKIFHDAEAKIYGYQEGSGKNEGKLGAYLCRNSEGIEFKVGSGLNDEMRDNPLPIGTEITYKYFEIIKESKKPRFPTFLRVYKKH